MGKIEDTWERQGTAQPRWSWYGERAWCWNKCKSQNERTPIYHEYEWKKLAKNYSKNSVLQVAPSAALRCWWIRGQEEQQGAQAECSSKVPPHQTGKQHPKHQALPRSLPEVGLPDCHSLLLPGSATPPTVHLHQRHNVHPLAAAWTAARCFALQLSPL